LGVPFRAKNSLYEIFGGEVMGRNAQPIEILKAKGKKHLAKAEIEHRQNSEIKLGDNKLKCPDFIKNDVEAFKKWKEVTKIYKDVDFISSGDVGLLARYCMTFSEYLKLIEVRRKLENIDVDWEQYEKFLPLDLRQGISRLLKLEPSIQIETSINKKMDILIKMEDRLFLNPLAKVKNVPKKEPEKQSPINSRFGDI
jgi:phage terminase small subunit